MPLNIPGLLAPFQLLFHPRMALPAIVVKDIRYIDFHALHRAGYRGAVFDKDNCLTRPEQDKLVPELQEAWRECRSVFGEGNVLVVSNSAGSHLDAGGIQSESVTFHLGVPILQHTSFKPAYSCISAIRAYFSSLKVPIRDNELIVVGDRILTDVILANRMRKSVLSSSNSFISMVFTCAFQKRGVMKSEKEASLRGKPLAADGPLSILTTGVWQRDSMVLRWIEKQLVDVVRRWSKSPTNGLLRLDEFVKEVKFVDTPKKRSIFDDLANLRRK